jgi:hypothetical protein
MIFSLAILDPGTGRKFQVIVNSADESRRGKVGALINAPSHGEHSNVRAPGFVGGPHIATCVIVKGTEILVSYGPQHRRIIRK